MKYRSIYFLCLILLLLALSHLSTYKIPDLTAASIDSVLILTPYGIIKNFIGGNTEFYFMVPPLRLENIWKNLSMYFPILFLSGFIILKKENE